VENQVLSEKMAGGINEYMGIQVEGSQSTMQLKEMGGVSRRSETNDIGE
jgi:hypothetical protein